MTVTAMDISSLRGTILALDSRRRDALATYARLAAEDAGVPPQTWVRKTWGFADYEAKALLRCDASEAMWERIVKHPNGGWAVVIPVMGAVIGRSLDDWTRDRLAAEERRLAREREQYEADRARLGTMAREVGALVGLGRGRRVEPDLREHRQDGQRDSRVGGRGDEEPVADRSFAPSGDPEQPSTFRTRGPSSRA